MKIEDKAKQIKLFILDVDGVMTDGRIIINNQKEESKSFNVKDGLGLKLLTEYGIELVIISGRSSRALEKRADELGILEVYQGVKDKVPLLARLMKEKKVEKEQVGCIGDDLPDIPLFRQSGLSFAVADAVPEVRAAADITTQSKGGDGAVREACEWILKAKGKWSEAVAKYIQA